MADPRIVTIGAGKDKASLAQALADETYKTLTTDNGNGGPGMLYYDCYNLGGSATETPSSVIDVSGFTCDASNYLVIRGAASELNAANRGKYSTNRYRIEPANNVSALLLSSAYVRVRDLQADIAAVASGGCYAFGASAGSTRAERCIAKCHGSGSNSGTYVGFEVKGSVGTSGFICVNCLAYDFLIGAESLGYGFKGGTTGHYMHCYNCTVADTYRSYWYTDGRVYVYNCGAAYCTAVNVYASDHCSWSNPTFVNRAADDYHLATTDAVWRGGGIDQSGYVTGDIDGEERAGFWDIGCDQAVIPRNPVPMDWIVS